MIKGVVVTGILILFIAFAGCEGMGVSVSYDDKPAPVLTVTTPNETPATIATPVVTATRPARINTTPITTVPTEEPTPTEPEITWTPKPQEEIPDIADPKQPYILYTDTDFKIQYPSNWSIVKINMNTPKTPYVRRDLLKDNSRMVRFESKQGDVNFTVQTSDFIVPGMYTMDTLIENAYRTVMERFNDVSGYSAVTNYEVRYTAQFQTPYVVFDVYLPKTSSSYPYAYTERNSGSYAHFYTIRFNTKGTLENYTEMKRIMFGSLITEERVKT